MNAWSSLTEESYTAYLLKHTHLASTGVSVVVLGRGTSLSMFPVRVWIASLGATSTLLSLSSDDILLLLLELVSRECSSTFSSPGIVNGMSTNRGLSIGTFETGRMSSLVNRDCWAIVLLLLLLVPKSHFPDLLFLCLLGFAGDCVLDILRLRASASARVKLRDMLSGDMMGESGSLRAGMFRPLLDLSRKLRWRLWYLQQKSVD